MHIIKTVDYEATLEGEIEMRLDDEIVREDSNCPLSTCTKNSS
jgi:hypothetical protein